MRSTFGSSPLVRQLAAWSPVDADPGMDFAERLSLWLNAFDAIALQAAHQSVRSIVAPGAQPAGRADAPDLAEDVRRVRSVLAKAIAQEVTDEPGYAPYQRRHQELQRQMELMIGPLRDHVRQAASRISAALRQLAVLDAAFEQILARREQALLPKTAALLKRRFDQLRSDDAPPDTFAAEWRQALLAELDLRLEPVTGLAEAAGNELKNRA